MLIRETFYFNKKKIGNIKKNLMSKISLKKKLGYFYFIFFFYKIKCYKMKRLPSMHFFCNNADFAAHLKYQVHLNTTLSVNYPATHTNI